MGPLFFLLSVLSLCAAQPFSINWEFIGATCTLAPTRVLTTNLNGTACEQQSCSPVLDRHRYMISRLTLCDVTSTIAPFQLVVRPYGVWVIFGTRATTGNAVMEIYNEATCSNPVNLVNRHQFWEPVGVGCLPDVFVPTFWVWYDSLVVVVVVVVVCLFGLFCFVWLVGWLLFVVVCCLLFVVCFLLFVVCCLLFVVCGGVCGIVCNMIFFFLKV
jgi:hypothetical protein